MKRSWIMCWPKVLLFTLLPLTTLGAFSAAQAQDTGEHPTETYVCEDLPPIGNAAVASVIGRLQKPGACPAGQFPRRYGSGKYLPRDKTCINPSDFPGRFDFSKKTPPYLGPYSDPDGARDMIVGLAAEAPCPPGLVQWHKDSKDGFVHPNRIVTDAAGDVFVSDPDRTAISELAVADGYKAVNPVGTTLGRPSGIAVDASGNAFIVAEGRKGVREILAADDYATATTVAPDLAQPMAVALDAAGNLFVIDGSAVREVPAAGNYATVETLADGFDKPTSLALDTRGDVFVMNSGNGSVMELAAGDTPKSARPIAGGFKYSTDLAADANGDVFVADRDSDAITELLAEGGYQERRTIFKESEPPPPIQLGMNVFPVGIAVDPIGDVFFTERQPAHLSPESVIVTEIVAAGGYNTVKTLPQNISGYGRPAVDGPGDVFVTDDGGNWPRPPNNGSVELMRAADGYAKMRTLGGTIAQPEIIGIDRKSRLIVVGDAATQISGAAIGDMQRQIYRIEGKAGGWKAEAILAGFVWPVGYALDGDDNIYVLDHHREKPDPINPGPFSYEMWIREYLASADYRRAVIFPFDIGKGVDQFMVDPQGRIFVSAEGEIDEITLADNRGTVKKVGSGLNQPEALVADGAGNIYVADYGDESVKEITAASGYAATLSRAVGIEDYFDALPGSTGNIPAAFAADRAGDLFAYDFNEKSVKEFVASGGYDSVVTLGRDAPTRTPVAETTPPHPVKETRCEKLPPTATPEVARIFAARLQDTGKCPAGMFPHRYGTGADLPNYLKCVRPESYPGRFAAFPATLKPIADVVDATALARALAETTQCPRGMAALYETSQSKAPIVPSPPAAATKDDALDWYDTASLTAGPANPLTIAPNDRVFLKCLAEAHNPLTAVPRRAGDWPGEGYRGVAIPSRDPSDHLTVTPAEISFCVGPRDRDSCESLDRINRQTSRFVEQHRDFPDSGYVNVARGNCTEEPGR